MKIEMGESIVLSWLRHAKNCQIVQLNWKPSVTTWNLYNEELIEEMMKKTQKYFEDKYELNLYKGNTSYSQLIQQGEVDVLGIEINPEGGNTLYGVDVAFHENGLNYGSKEETTARVVKKMIRTAMMICGYFNVKEGELIFASPKINNSTLQLLEECMKDLNGPVNEQLGLNFKYELICNDNFKDKIFNVITALSKSIADTSELFMRSIQMYNLFEKEKVKVADATTRTRTPRENKVEVDIDASGYEEIKIGALVRSTMPELIKEGIISQNEITRLLDADYSKRTFDLNYPVLKELKPGVSIKEQRFEGDYTRYYAIVLKGSGKEYLLCSEWFDWNKPYYIKWYENIKTYE